MQVLKGRRHLIQELAFSHCGRWLAATGYAGGVHVWDTANPTARPLQPEPGEIRWAEALAFRSDGRLFFRDARQRLYLYDPAAGTLTPPGLLRVRHLVPAPDASRVIQIREESPLRSWSIRPDGTSASELFLNCEGTFISTAAFAPGGAALVTVETRRVREGLSRTDTHVLAIREAESGKVTRELSSPAFGIDQVAFSPNAAFLLARWSASVGCWRLAEPDKSLRKAVNPSRKHFLSTAVHPDGPLLTVDNDRLVRVWNVPALTTDRSITWNIGKLHAVAVSPDGTRAAVGSHTGKVLVWDWD